ncbi:MAG: hypothetical protein LBM93_06975, partial [Oscillospiraceae bacterium]|nr:hypothetical protein [Oscillospiraceae bacterium]
DIYYSLQEENAASGISAKYTISDNYFLNVQNWLLQEYPGIVDIEANGKCEWRTIYALRRVLQLEMGITELSDNFGETTSSYYEKNILGPGSSGRLVAILQCALGYKGYNPGYNFSTTQVTEGKIVVSM